MDLDLGGRGDPLPAKNPFKLWHVYTPNTWCYLPDRRYRNNVSPLLPGSCGCGRCRLLLYSLPLLARVSLQAGSVAFFCLWRSATSRTSSDFSSFSKHRLASAHNGRDCLSTCSFSGYSDRSCIRHAAWQGERGGSEEDELQGLRAVRA